MMVWLVMRQHWMRWWIGAIRHQSMITSTKVDENLWCHYSDIIMSAMASQITIMSIICSAICSGTHQRKLQSSALLAFVRGNPLVTGRVPSQRASNMESISIWWCHHGTIRHHYCQLIENNVFWCYHLATFNFFHAHACHSGLMS